VLNEALPIAPLIHNIATWEDLCQMVASLESVIDHLALEFTGTRLEGVEPDPAAFEARVGNVA